MSTTIQRRVEALEGPGRGACLACELAALGRSAAAADGKLPACTHWPRRTLADELIELNTTEGMTP